MSYKYRTRPSKGDLMKKVWPDENEYRKLDGGTPASTWKEFPPQDHVMSYNEPHSYGKLVNIEEEAKKRGVKLWHQPKISFKDFNNIEYMFESMDLFAENTHDPGTMREYIDFFKEMIDFENLRKNEE